MVDETTDDMDVILADTEPVDIDEDTDKEPDTILGEDSEIEEESDDEPDSTLDKD